MVLSWCLAQALAAAAPTPSPTPAPAAPAPAVHDGQIAGVVVDARTQAALADVPVVATLPNGTTRTTRTTKAGRYRFSGLPEGTYRLTVSMGAAEVTRQFQLGRDQKRRADVSLVPRPTTAREVSMAEFAGVGGEGPERCGPWWDPTRDPVHRYMMALELEAIREAFSR